MSKLDELDTLLRNMRTELNNSIFEPFEHGRMAAYLENALSMIADMKAPPIARAPGKHEPEPIVIAAKPARHRAQKGH